MTLRPVGATLADVLDVSEPAAPPALRMLKGASRVCVVALVATFALAVGTSASAAGNCAAHPRPGIDWHGCDLHGRNLSGANLSGANLNGANLTRTNLTRTKLTKAT